MKKLFSLLLLLTLSLTLAGCDDATSDDLYSYDDYIHLTNFSQIQTQYEDTYLVYYYSVSCSHCSIIKDIVLEFAESNPNDIAIYLIDAYNVGGTNYVEGMGGTPALLTIVSGQIVDMNVGSLAIPIVIEDIDNGYYSYTD